MFAGGLGRGFRQAGGRYTPLPALPLRMGSGAAGGGLADTGFALLPDQGGIGITGSEARNILINMGLTPAFDLTAEGFKPVVAVLGGNPWLRSIGDSGTQRLRTDTFSSSKPFEQRYAEAQEVIDSYVRALPPGHREAMEAPAGGRPLTPVDFNLMQALREGSDPALVHRVKVALAQQVAETGQDAAVYVPEANQIVVLRPSALSRQVGGGWDHASPDVSWAEPGTVVSALPGKTAAELGAFVAPAGPPTAPLKGSYSGITGGPSAKPGIVHLPSSGQVSPEFTGVATSDDIVSPPKLWYTEGPGLRHPAAEIEGMVPITTRTARLIKGLKLIGGQGHYYTQEGAPPLTRAQARMAIARQVMEDLRLRPRRGLKVLTPEKAAREDLAVHTLDDLTRGGPMDADPLRQPFTPPAAQLPTSPTMQFKVDRIRPPQMTGEGVGIVVRAPETLWNDGRDSSRREGATHPPRDRSSSTPPSGGTGSTSFPAARETVPFADTRRGFSDAPGLNPPRVAPDDPDFTPPRPTLDDPDFIPKRTASN